MNTILLYFSTLYATALNEFRNIRRNPVILIAGLIYLTVFFVTIGLFGKMWRQRAISSALPYVILRYMNLFQAIIASVIASQFWADDFRLNTTPAIHTRSFANPIYILGKTLGIAAVYFIINAALLVLILLVDVVFLDDVTNSFAVYGLYALVIPFPTLVFVTGFTYITMRLVKNQGIAISILSGLFILLYATSGPETGFITDPTASQLPLLYSDFVGFGNERMILLHRGLHVFLGLGLIALSAATFDRLRQSIPSTVAMLLISALCFYGVYRFGDTYLSEINSGRVLRQSINELNLRHEKDARVSVTDCDLDLVHNGNEIDVTAHLAFTNKNGEPITEYLFSLNPGLKILSVHGKNGEELGFIRELHLLSVTPDSELMPGGSDFFMIHYSGTIDENACYPDLDETERFRPHEYFRFIVDKRYAYVTPEYVLLTSEAIWYPVPGVYDLAVSGDWSGREFTRYTLDVTTAPDLTAVSQGKVDKSSELLTTFTPETPLTQISLVIGEYERRTLEVDCVEVSLYLKPGHDFFSRQFKLLDKTELEKLLEEKKQDFEVNVGIKYPFPRFVLVEVPVSFLAYPRFRPYPPETVQPEQVFIPEKTVFMRTGFEERLPDAMRWHEVQSPLDGEKLVTDEFFRELFWISNARALQRQKSTIMQNKGLSWEKINWKTRIRSNHYDFSIFPNYYWFCNILSVDTVKEYDLLIGAYLRWKVRHFITTRNRFPWDIAAAVLHNCSFEDFLDDPKYIDISHEVIEIKAEESLKMCMALSKIDEQTFDKFVVDFLERNRFVSAEAGMFADEYFDKFGIDIRKIFKQRMTADQQPKYEISDIYGKSFNVLRSGRVYNMYATILNVSDVPGVVSPVTVDIERNVQNELIYLEPGKAVKVGFVSRIPFRNTIRFTNYLSENEYWSDIDVYPSTKVEEGTPFAGIQFVGSPPTRHEMGHFEIDNLDKGFSVLPAPPEKTLRSKVLFLFAEPKTVNSTFAAYNLKNPPLAWTLSRKFEFKGYEDGVHYIRAGNGNRSVQWETNIIRPGKYRIQFHVPRKNSLAPPAPGLRRTIVADFHFTIHHDEGVTEKVLDIKQVQRGWRSLGTYEFSKGPAKVVLSDKSDGKFVYADTIKFDIIE